MEAATLASHLQDWTDGDGPLYSRLAAAMARLIRDGDLAVGARLPAERQLARQLQLSRTTVTTAYSHLERDGLVARRHGSGTYVRARNGAVTRPHGLALTRSLEHNEIFAGLIQPARELLDLRVASLVDAGDLPPSVLATALQQVARMAHGHGYLPAGLPLLRDRVAHRYTEQGLPTGIDEVLVTSGAQQAISLIASHYLAPGDVVLVEEVTHTGAIDAFVAQGARVVGVPMTPQGVDLVALESALERHAPRLVHLTPSVHNPLGVTMPPAARRRLGELVAAHPTTVFVVDETLAELWISSPTPAPVGAYEGGRRVLHLGSASKTYWAGLRVGWVRGPAIEIRSLARIKAVTDLGTGVPGQLIAAGLLAAEPGWMAQRRQILRARRDHLAAAVRRHLPSWRFQLPDGGVCLWIRLPGVATRDLVPVAARHGVAIAPGSLHSPDERFVDCLRLPYSQPPDVLDLGISRLAAAWAELQSLPVARDPLQVVV